MDKGYLGYVHSFRGFAILNIVAIHAIAFALLLPADWDLDPTSPLYVLNEMLFHDATVYFALISGLLFSSILRPRGYRRFYRSKLLNVLVPYLFCTVVFSAMNWNIDGTGVLALPQDWSSYVNSILPNLFRGEAQFTYWYIPVLLFLFAITPLLSRLTRFHSYAVIPAWLIMFLPLIFSRPEFDPELSQVTVGTLMYFSGAYTVGIYLGNNLEQRLDKIAGYRKYLYAGAVATSVAITLLQFSQVNRFGDFSLQESLFYIQKLCMAALVLLWLRDLATHQPRWMTFFANEAFSIYFLHAFFVALLAEALWKFQHNQALLPWSIYLASIAYFAFALAMSLLVVFLLRQALGRWSRVLVGS
jgi:surface polysaccharide O-acyltransferase-like enzyme